MRLPSCFRRRLGSEIGLHLRPVDLDDLHADRRPVSFSKAPGGTRRPWCPSRSAHRGAPVCTNTVTNHGAFDLDPRDRRKRLLADELADLVVLDQVKPKKSFLFAYQRGRRISHGVRKPVGWTFLHGYSRLLRLRPRPEPRSRPSCRSQRLADRRRGRGCDRCGV